MPANKSKPMAKATKPLGGAAKDKYFRELFAAAPGLDQSLAKHLTDMVGREIAQVRVRLPLPVRGPVKPAKGKRGAELAKSADTPATPVQTAETMAPPVVPPQAPAQPAPSAEPAGQDFDPFAFSATVVLKRKGKAELEKLLAAVAEPAHLKLIAEKQHLGVASDIATANELRAAIVAAAEARINDRRAAAS